MDPEETARVKVYVSDSRKLIMHMSLLLTYLQSTWYTHPTKVNINENIKEEGHP